MKMPIEMAVQLARHAASQQQLAVVGGRTAKIADIVAARHASNLGEPDDKWIIVFKIDWQGLRVFPDSLIAYVDSQTGKVTFPPAM